MYAPRPSPTVRAIDIFRRRGGTLRTRDAIEAGIHPRTLYDLRDEGEIEQVSRGVYRLADLDTDTDPDLLAVAARIPRGVICLTSALSLHELTTQIPHEVDVALLPGAWTPTIEHPPIRVFRFSEASMRTGVESRKVDGITMRLFNAEKSIADCFKYRNKIGQDIAVEALRMYRARRKQNLSALMRYAKINRVDSVMRPYIEATLT